MNNVTSINSKMVLGSYIDAQSSEQRPEEVFFVVGAILALVLPPIGLYSVFGWVMLLAFAVIAVAGARWGKAMYNRGNNWAGARIFTGAIPRTPRGEGSKFRDAA